MQTVTQDLGCFFTLGCFFWMTTLSPNEKIPKKSDQPRVYYLKFDLGTSRSACLSNLCSSMTKSLTACT